MATQQNTIDVEQVIYAIERAERRLQAEADTLHEQMDYSAEFPSEDAERMREAIELLRAFGSGDNVEAEARR